MFKIRTLNNISADGLRRFPVSTYLVGDDIVEPDALLLRSADLHKQEIPNSVKAVARAGAGTNNIPIERLSARGIPVFNTPGANANAVKELVLAAMLMCARRLLPAVEFVRSLETEDHIYLNQQVEAGKRRFVGFELAGQTLGVIGLGAVGVRVANAALDLGMAVFGYDPTVTVQNAWQLNAEIKRVLSVENLLTQSKIISLHVPLLGETRNLINADRLRVIGREAILLNFSRAEIVDEHAVMAALDEGVLSVYASDFPSPRMSRHPKVIAMPHLGASTAEAEENCAAMAVDQLREFLESGNVRNAVNLPEIAMPLTDGWQRLSIIHANVPNMVGQISSVLARHQLNIADLLNKSRGEIACTLIDVETELPLGVTAEIAAIPGVRCTRAIDT